MSAGNYAHVAPDDDVLFDASKPDATTTAAPNLTFQDFGAGSSTGGRLSPAPGLYGPDVEMQKTVGSGGVFSLENYTKYFDVDTKLVLDRSWRTLYPANDYVEHVLNHTPDLYGPFWLPTTLILVLFLSSSISSSIAAYLSSQPYVYDFTRLGAAVTIVYLYAFVVPVGLWAVMRYWAGVENRSPADLVALYGYGMLIWNIVALLCIPPVQIARFAFTATAFALSGFFLLRNIYPLLSTAPSKAARILIVAVGLIHAALALALWVGFFGSNGGSVASHLPHPVEGDNPSS